MDPSRDHLLATDLPRFNLAPFDGVADSSDLAEFCPSLGGLQAGVQGKPAPFSEWDFTTDWLDSQRVRF